MVSNMTEDYFNFTSNFTTLDELFDRRSEFLRISGTMFIVITSLTSFFGNLAVVLASSWTESLRAQTGNILIVYLSIIDMMTAVLVMLPSAIAVVYDDWVIGPSMCRMHALFNYCCACSSSFNLAVISFDRFVAVVYPLQYPSWMTKKVLLIFCAYTFTQGGLVGFVCSMPRWSGWDYREAMCALLYTSNEDAYYVLTIGGLFCYYFPASMMLACNAMIIYSAKKSKSRVNTLFVRQLDGKRAEKSSQSDSEMKKTIKSMVVVILVYYVCFTPYSLSKQVKVTMKVDGPSWWNFVTTLFIFVSSASNPFIYAILRKDYRNAFKKLPKMIVEKFFRR